MEFLKKNKKFLIIILIILLVIAGGLSLYWFVFRQESEQANDTNIETEDNSNGETAIPEYEAKDLSEFYPEVLSAASDWASDYRIHSITATTSYISSEGKKIYFGTDRGRFSSWMFDLYSPSKKATVVYLYKNGEGSLGEDLPIDNEYILPSYDSKAYFNDLESLRPTQEVYSILIESGFVQTIENHIYMYLGDSETVTEYANRYVWRIVDRSNLEVDENEIPLVNKEYFVDGLTLESLSKI